MNYQKKQKQVFSVYMIYFLVMLLFCTVRILTSKNIIHISNYYVYELVYSLLVQGLIMVGIPFLLFYLLMPKKEQIVRNTLKFRPIKGKAIGITFLIGIILFILNIGVASFFNGMITFFGYQAPLGLYSSPSPTNVTIGTFFFELLITAVIPAFCEEFLHRGILLGGISPIGYAKAIFFSSLLFGMMHMSITQVFYATILGMVIGFLVVMTKSIWVGIILHFTNNALNVYLSYASRFHWVGGNFYDILDLFLTSSNIFISFLSVFALIVVLGMVLAYLVTKLYRRTTLDSVGEALQEVLKIEEDEQTAKIVQEVIENNSSLTTNYSLKQNPLILFLPKDKNTIKSTLKENSFLIGSIVLGILVNLSTFIWGLF